MQGDAENDSGLTNSAHEVDDEDSDDAPVLIDPASGVDSLPERVIKQDFGTKESSQPDASEDYSEAAPLPERLPLDQFIAKHYRGYKPKRPFPKISLKDMTEADAEPYVWHEHLASSKNIWRAVKREQKESKINKAQQSDDKSRSNKKGFWEVLKTVTSSSSTKETFRGKRLIRKFVVALGILGPML